MTNLLKAFQYGSYSRHIFDYVLFSEYSRAYHEFGYTGFGQPQSKIDIYAAVDSYRDTYAQLLHKALGLFDLFECMLRKTLPPEAGLYAHYQ